VGDVKASCALNVSANELELGVEVRLIHVNCFPMAMNYPHGENSQGRKAGLIERQVSMGAPIPHHAPKISSLLYYLCSLIVFGPIRYFAPWFSIWLFSGQFSTWEWVPTFPAMFLNGLAVGAVEALLWAYLLRKATRALRWTRIWQWSIAGAALGMLTNRSMGFVEHLLGIDYGHQTDYKFFNFLYLFFAGPSFGLDARAAVFLLLATSVTAAALRWLSRSFEQMS
jgi:hypothetical protein